MFQKYLTIKFVLLVLLTDPRTCHRVILSLNRYPFLALDGAVLIASAATLALRAQSQPSQRRKAGSPEPAFFLAKNLIV